MFWLPEKAFHSVVFCLFLSYIWSVYLPDPYICIKLLISWFSFDYHGDCPVACWKVDGKSYIFLLILWSFDYQKMAPFTAGSLGIIVSPALFGCSCYMKANALVTVYCCFYCCCFCIYLLYLCCTSFCCDWMLLYRCTANIL